MDLRQWFVANAVELGTVCSAVTGVLAVYGHPAAWPVFAVAVGCLATPTAVTVYRTWTERRERREVAEQVGVVAGP